MRLLYVALVGALASSFAFAQNSSQGLLRALNAQVLQLRGVAASGNASDQSAARSQAAEALTRRQQVLEALIASNPTQALELSFPSSVLDDLAETFPESAGALEQRGTVRGMLYVTVEDGVGFTSHKENHKLKVGDQMIDLYSVDQADAGSQCNQFLAASGVKSGNVMGVESSVVEGTAAGCSTIGAQKIAVIMLNFPGGGSNTLPGTMTADFLRGAFLGNAATTPAYQVSPDRSISDFWTESSDGKTWVNNTGSGALTVLGPYTLDQAYDYCNSTTAFRNAAYAAADAWVNYNEYSRVVFIVPHNNTCNGTAGVGTIGCWGSEAPGDGATNIAWTWWRADQISNRNSAVMLATHELGHTLGMSHSGSRYHGSLVVDNIGVAGFRTEYNDRFSTMGNWNLGFYNSPQALNIIGWLSASNVQTVTGTGVYTIQGYDTRPGGIKALKIARGTGTTNAYYYLTYFPDRGNYLGASSFPAVHGGALIHYQDSATPSIKTDLLDFSPTVVNTSTTTPDFTNPVLPIGATWVDPYRDVQIQVNGVNTINNTMTVTVTFSPPACTPSNPTTTFLTTTGSASPGSSANYTVQVLNNDSSSCGPRDFTMSASLTAGSGVTLSYANPVLHIGPGATLNATLTASTTSSTAEGTYIFSASATSGANSDVTNTNASLTVQIAPPATPTGVSATTVNSGTGRNKTFQYIRVQWGAVIGATSYDIQRCKVSGKGGGATCVYAPLMSTTGTSINDVPTSTGTYRYQVRAVNAATSLTSNWSAAVQANR